MSGKEALNLPRRLEPLHDPLSSSGRLMRGFGPVIQALVLPMLDPGHDLPLGRGVAPQLVGDEHTRGSALLLAELSAQALGSLLVGPALDENIDNERHPSGSCRQTRPGGAQPSSIAERRPLVCCATSGVTAVSCSAITKSALL